MYISTLMISLCIINHLYWATAVPRIRCQDPTSKRSLPSWELTYIIYIYIYIHIDIPRWRKENHLQKWCLMGYVSCQEGISVVYKLCSAATSGEVNFEVLHSWRSQEQAIFWHQDCWATKKKPPTFHHTGYYFIEILIMVYFNPHIYIYNWVGKSPMYPKQPGLFSMLSSRHAIVTVIHDPTEAWVLHGTMNLFGGDTALLSPPCFSEKWPKFIKETSSSWEESPLLEDHGT